VSYKIKVAFTQEHQPDYISWFVMLALNRMYSHVIIVFEDIDDKEKIFHCIGEGTLIDEEKVYLKTHTIIKQYEIPMKCSRVEFADWARKKAEKKIEYSNRQYVNIAVKFAIRFINNWIGLKIKTPVIFRNGDAAEVCSEAVASASHMSHLEVPATLELDMIDPEEIDDFLAGQQKAKRTI